MPRSDLLEWAQDLFITEHGLRERKTFGCPSFYVDSSMAAFIYKDSLVLRLPDEEVGRIVSTDTEIFGRFTPMSKPLRGWLTITRPEACEYEADIDLIRESLAHTASVHRQKKPSTGSMDKTRKTSKIY